MSDLYLKIATTTFLSLLGLKATSAYSQASGERNFRSSYNPVRNEFITTSYDVDYSSQQPSGVILRRQNHLGENIGDTVAIEVSGYSQIGTHALNSVNDQLLVTYCANSSSPSPNYSLQFQIHKASDLSEIAGSHTAVYSASDYLFSCEYVEAAYHKGLQKYLLAWQANGSIYGRFVDSAGSLLGNEFTIASSTQSSKIRMVADHRVNGKFFVLFLKAGNHTLATISDDQSVSPPTATITPPAFFKSGQGALAYRHADSSLVFLGIYNDNRNSSIYRSIAHRIVPGNSPAVVFEYSYTNSVADYYPMDLIINEHTQTYEVFTGEWQEQSPNRNNKLIRRTFSIDRTVPNDSGPAAVFEYLGSQYLNSNFDSKATFNPVCGNIFIANALPNTQGYLVLKGHLIGAACQPIVSKDQTLLSFPAAFLGAKLLPKTIKFRADLIDTTFGSASLVGPQANMFMITADTCANTSVLAKSECSVSVAPIGSQVGQFEAQLRVPVTNGTMQNVTLKSQFAQPRVIKPIAPAAKAMNVRSQKTHLIWEATTETQGGQYKVTVCENPDGLDCKPLTLPVLRQP